MIGVVNYLTGHRRLGGKGGCRHRSTRAARRGHDRAGGSSAAAGKRNPIDAMRATAAAQACFGIATVITPAKPHELERGVGSWHAEWFALPLVFQTAAASLEAISAALASLEVEPSALGGCCRPARCGGCLRRPGPRGNHRHDVVRHHVDRDPHRLLRQRRTSGGHRWSSPTRWVVTTTCGTRR